MNASDLRTVSAEAIESEREKFRSALEKITMPSFGADKKLQTKVVAIEGPNATGKSTLCKTLSSRLQAPACLGTDLAWSAEPFKTRMIRDAEWHASALFFLSGCFEQMRLLRNRSEPLIFMDRSIWSTLAVHAATDIDRLQVLLDVLRPLSTHIDLPARTLVLDASFATCQARIAKKTGAARALDELTANALFHMREREFYRWLEHRAPGIVFLNVDEDTAEEAARKAIEMVRGFQC